MNYGPTNIYNSSMQNQYRVFFQKFLNYYKGNFKK